jgi:hypothetical protein
VRQRRPVDQGAGQRGRAKSLRRAAGMVVLAILMSVTLAAATPLDDLLFDLRFVPLDGRPAHQFTLPGLDGQPVSLHQFKDRAVLLYFWASW